MNMDEMKDRIARAEEIQRYTENRCEALEKENAELKAFKQDCIKLTEDNVVMARQRAEMAEQLTEARQFIRDFLSVAIDYIDKEDKNYSLITEAEQFLSEVEK